jgi:ankyrin repeat protein
LASKADVGLKDRYGDDALIWAAWFGQFETAKLLIESGAPVNSTNINGLSPLHLAKSAKVATLLLQAGANPSMLSSHGRSPIDWAIRERRYDVLQVLTNAAR